MNNRYVVIAALALVGCATSPEEDPVQIRMNDLDQRLQRIERVLTNQSLLQMAQRIDALQADLSRMRGEVELLQIIFFYYPSTFFDWSFQDGNRYGIDHRGSSREVRHCGVESRRKSRQWMLGRRRLVVLRR